MEDVISCSGADYQTMINLATDKYSAIGEMTEFCLQNSVVSYAKPLFHSDRGFQYTSKVFQMKLRAHEMEQSMSRVGHCIDNGPTEGFWSIIKSEMYQMY